MRGSGGALALVVVLGLGAGTARAQTVEAKLDRLRLGAGETTTLRVTVRTSSGVGSPEFDLPRGLEVVSSGQQQSFSWVNGRASNEREFRYEILARSPGRYGVGPILVRVGNQVYRSGVLELVVVDAEALGPAARDAPASLRVDVDPRSPYVGQEMFLRVRLIQRSAFAEDPQYTPPSTTGFWTDRASAPESYYGVERGQRVLVTETRTRLYPLAPGEGTIGEATALVVLSEDSGPLGWLGGERREVMLRSAPVTIRVRPLPSGTPVGFTGAVGRFETSWSADRSRTSRDVPITVRLDVRGRGNLPLVRPPSFSSSEVEIFASTVEDSLSTPGGGGWGRKRFQWTLLPRREGALRIDPPAFAWFDPEGGGYRRANQTAIEVEVGPPIYTASGAEAGFPRSLADHPASPGGRPPEPWLFTLVGFALGGAASLWRRGGPGGRRRHEAHEWRNRLSAATGFETWKVAEQALDWLESSAPLAGDTQVVRQRIASVRYGGGGGDPEAVRAPLLAMLERAEPRERAGIPRRLAAVVLIALAAGAAFAWGPRPASRTATEQSLAADQAARRGELAKARAVWSALWRGSGEDAGLAGRLAWAHVQAGEIGPAALWVLRGEMVEPRDAGLSWVADRVREAGGLVGATSPRWPIRRSEWSALGLVLGLTATAFRSRRVLAAGCAALALVAAGTYPAQGWWAGRSGRAVMLSATPLEGSDVALDPGQMVWVKGRQGNRVRVAAGRVAEGWVPSTSVARVASDEDGHG